MQNRVLRGNTVPQGGAVNPVVGGVAGGGMLLPDTGQTQAMANVLFEHSEQNYLQLNEERLIPGGQTNFRLQNVGLGEGLEIYVTGSFNVRNSHATVAQTVDIAPEFPFNTISNLNLMFNGKVAIINCDGYQLLNLMLKRNFRNMFLSGGNRIDSRIARVTVTGAGVTTVAGETLTGISRINIPAMTTATVAYELYLDVPFTLRKDLPFGLLPMNHNAIHAGVTITTRHLIGANPESPLFAAGANVAVDGVPDIRVLPTYNFWGLPANPEIYQFFTNNSYVVTSLPRNPIGSVGERALSFNFPLNYWLISALFTIRNSVGVLADVRTNVNFPHLVYNGTVNVDRSEIRTRIAREILATGRQYPYGCLFFDSAQTNNLDGNSANTSKWLNMYQANNPAFFAHIAGLTMPGSFDVLLEQIVPNYVTVL